MHSHQASRPRALTSKLVSRCLRQQYHYPAISPHARQPKGPRHPLHLPARQREPHESHGGHPRSYLLPDEPHAPSSLPSDLHRGYLDPLLQKHLLVSGIRRRCFQAVSLQSYPAAERLPEKHGHVSYVRKLGDHTRRYLPGYLSVGQGPRSLSYWTAAVPTRFASALDLSHPTRG